MKKIELPLGLEVKYTYDYLLKKALEYREPVYGNFNDNQVNSTMSEDDIFLTITGKHKDEWDGYCKAEKEKMDALEKQYQDRVPELKKEYLREASTAYYFKKEMFNDFNDILEKHLRSLYHDCNIRCMLEICKVLADNKENKSLALKTAKQVFDNQGHSGHSAGITASLVSLFSLYFGPEFYDYAYLGK